MGRSSWQKPEKGIRVKTSSFARSHVNTSMSKSKAAGNYINSILAKVEAKEDGYDEAVMLDTNGYVSEAGENTYRAQRRYQNHALDVHPGRPYA